MDHPAPIDDDCFAEAARWCVRLRDDAGESTRRAYGVWLAADPSHPPAMAEARLLFDQLEIPAERMVQREVPAPRRRVTPFAYGIAASMLLVALAGGLWLARSPHHDATTTVGESRTLKLEDGSEVILATDSAVDIDMKGTQRHVRLVRGEALFHVAHDPTRPFVVETSNGHARVLGTVFDVRLRDGQTRVGVIEGRVAVAGSGGGDDVLAAGDAVNLDVHGVTRVTDIPVASMTAWTRGQLVFYRAPLDDVMAEVGRYRRGVIVVRGNALRALPVSGSFDVTQPDRAVDAVVASLKLHQLRAGTWLTVVY